MFSVSRGSLRMLALPQQASSRWIKALDSAPAPEAISICIYQLLYIIYMHNYIWYKINIYTL